MKETIYSYFMRQVEINPDVVAVFDPHPVSAKAHTMADAINFLKFIFLFSFSNRQRIEKAMWAYHIAKKQSH